MSRNEGAKYDLVSGDVLLAARHDLDCYLEALRGSTETRRVVTA